MSDGLFAQGGIKVEKGGEGSDALFEWVSDIVLEWSVEILKDHQLLRDYERLRPDIEKEMPQIGGVALRLSIGMKPADNNKYIQEYLGLRILGPALSPQEAEVKYGEHPSPEMPFGKTCKITDLPDTPSGPTIGPDTRKAATSGLDAGLLRYADANPSNADDSGGMGIIMRPYVKTETVFVGQDFLRRKK
jgi:hypothetical protein